MKEDSVVQFRQPGAFLEETLTEVLRAGARQLDTSKNHAILGGK